MLVFFAIVLILLTAVAAPIRVGITAHIDFFENDGFIRVRLFGLKIFHARIYFEHDEQKYNSIVIEKGKKTKKVHINADTHDKKSVAAMLKNPAFSLAILHKLELGFTVGNSDDAFFTALVLAAVKAVAAAGLTYLSCRQPTQISSSFTPDFRADKLFADFGGIIHINIANIIIGYVTGKIKQRQEEVRN